MEPRILGYAESAEAGAVALWLVVWRLGRSRETGTVVLVSQISDRDVLAREIAPRPVP